MKTMMIACDNPKCKNVAPPEWMSATGRSHRPPYGWLSMKGDFCGTGPSIKVEVCGIECLEPAVYSKYNEFYEQ